MNILEEMEKLIQEQQYRHKSMAPVEYTVQQWMCQLRQQEQMLNEHFLQAQHPEIISVYNFLAKFVKEQLQQEMDFQTECKQMYGFVHHKLSMNFNLIQKLIAISNSEQHGRQGEEEELGGTSPVKRMYLVKLEQIIQEMYDQTMLTQAIQESMHEACQTRCIQLKEYMNLLENLTINKTKLTTNHREDRFAELKDIQITLEKYQRDAAEYIVKHVESRQFRKDEDKKINTVPVYYNAQTRSLWSRGIELTGLYMAPVNSDYPVVSVTPVAVRQPEQRFTLDQEKEINMLKKNEMIEMDLLNLIEAMHSLESLRDTAECLRDTALSMRKQEQQKPMKLSAKFTTKVSFSPLQAYISSTLDEAERQLIEETMASLTQTTITPVQAKKYNYLMPQKCIEPLNEVEIYAQFQNQEQAMTPVVIVHPIEGHTNTLRNLAKNIRAPVYGIQYTREALKYETVEELAQYYWTQIKKVFGDNARVHLCGHAFGAMVAMEMAICKPARCVSLTILDDNVEKISYDMYREAREEMEADALMKFALQYYQTMNKVQFFQQLTEFKTTEQRIRFVVRELVNRSQFQFETLDLDWAARAYITKYVMHCMYTPKSQLRLPTVYYVKCGGEKRCESPLVKIASVRRTYLKSLIEQCFAGKLKTESVECDVRSFLEGNNGYQVATIMNENLLRHF
jgi:thioesterase domain-containing protein